MGSAPARLRFVGCGQLGQVTVVGGELFGLFLALEGEALPAPPRSASTAVAEAMATLRWLPPVNAQPGSRLGASSGPDASVGDEATESRSRSHPRPTRRSSTAA